MRKVLRQIFKNELVLLTLFLLKLWFTLVHLDHRFNTSSKYRYVRANDSQFVLKYQLYANETRNAYAHMRDWLQLKSHVHSTPLFDRSEATRLCVGVLSQRRPSVPARHFNYAFETVVALLVRTRLRHEREVRIDVLNVDANARTDLADLIGLVNIVDLRQNLSQKLERKEPMNNPKLKETADYINAMEYYMNTHPKCEHVLLLEDDSLPSPDWYEKVAPALAYLSTFDNNWYLLKLFTSFRSYDWLIHIPTVLISMFIALALTFAFVRFFYFLLYLKHRFVFGESRPLLHRSKLVVLIFLLNSMLIVSLFNSTSVSPLGYGVHSFAIGFNTVANVFPQSKLASIAAYLDASLESYVSGRTNTFQPKDLALNGFRSKSRLKEMILEPAPFQHVGLQSSLGSATTWKDISMVQYRPFQSYSFEKEYSSAHILFDPVYWTT